MDRKEQQKEYTNGEITVTWEPHKCIHSGKCFAGLSTVFQPMRRPWIRMEREDSKTIARQVDSCPSQALKWHKNEG